MGFGTASSDLDFDARVSLVRGIHVESVLDLQGCQNGRAGGEKMLEVQVLWEDAIPPHVSISCMWLSHCNAGRFAPPFWNFQAFKEEYDHESWQESDRTIP
jgi:hypothetical protein